MIGALSSQNTYNTSSRKECNKDSAGKPVHDEGYDDIASHQESMFSVKSRLGKEQGQKKNMDSWCDAISSYPFLFYPKKKEPYFLI